MAESLTEKTVEKTAEELEAEADERERKAKAQARIDATTNQSAASWLKGKIGVLREVKNEVITTTNNGLKQEQDMVYVTSVADEQNESIPLPFEEAKAVYENSQNDSLDSSKNAGKSKDSTEPNEPDALWQKEAMALFEDYPKLQSWLSRGQRTATIEEIVAVTLQSKRKIVNRVHDGTLKRSPRNAQLILISSVIEWLKATPPPRHNADMPDGQQAVTLVEKAS